MIDNRWSVIDDDGNDDGATATDDDDDVAGADDGSWGLTSLMSTAQYCCFPFLKYHHGRKSNYKAPFGTKIGAPESSSPGY